MRDLIERKAAIDVIDKILPADPMRNEYTQGITCGAALAMEYVKQLPSAQPETHEKRTETHACDLISRQAAIDAILAVTGNSSVRELYEHVQEHGLSDMWSGGVNAAIDIIIAVPSAQLDMSEYSDKLWKAAYERGKAEAQQRWIPCSERLPEEDHWLGGSGMQFSDEVLVSVVNYDDEDIWTYISQTIDGEWALELPSHCKIIAWMPLPEPYAERREE